MITNDKDKLESVKSEEYLDVDNMYSIIPIDVRLHMQRVCRYACIITELADKSGSVEEGEELEMIVSDSRDIYMYHDIGYSFLPVRTMCRDKEKDILDIKKFYELDFDGESVFNAHVELASEAFDLPIFNRFSKNVFRQATLTAMHHHERWDGNGFPKGLKGKDIPLVARICAVADMYDMLLEFNPYMANEDNAGIIQGLEQVAGSFLDPALVSLVKANADIFKEYDNECGNVVLY